MVGEDITLEQLRQLLGVQSELRERAESHWQRSQRALVTLLETFAPEEVDRRLKSGEALDSLDVEELALLISAQISAQLNTRLRQSQGTPNTHTVQSLNDRLQASQSEIDRLQKENRQLSEEIQLLREQYGGLQSQLTAMQQVQAAQALKPNEVPTEQTPSAETPQNKGAPEPEWMAAWRRTETFERDVRILKMIGETGLARRPLIEAQAAELLGIKKAGGSIQTLMARLVRLKVIEIFRPWTADGSGTGGRYPDLVRLTDQGKLAFWMLTGNQSQSNEYDSLLKRHVSPEHTLLNLQAADILRQAGYQVNLTPPEIQLPNKEVFMPDLALVDENGATIFVEVERDTDKNIESRQPKWRNFYQASGGRLYVVCENRTSMRNIRSEINYCLGSKPGVVSLTTLADLQAGKRGG